MSDDLTTFRDELIAQVLVRASADRNFKQTSFAELCGELLEEAGELEDFQPCYFRGKGARQRNLAVDGYNFDEVDFSFRILLADFSGLPKAAPLTRTEARALFASAVAFVEEALQGRLSHSFEESSPEYGFAKQLHDDLPKTNRYRFYLATDRLLSERVKDWPEGTAGNLPTEFHIWDISRFYRAHESQSGRDALEIDFSAIVEGGIPCLPASVHAKGYEGYLCVIPGTALAAIYETFGSRLLEGNVRAYLSSTGKVNKGILVTLRKEPEMFFAYNNGIAATASSVVTNGTSTGMRIISATDFQIVNGGQTTASLEYALQREKTDISSAFVQMKLSVVEDDRAGNIIPLISRFANSQNRVSDADFFSNHDFHRAIEKISRRLRAPATHGSQIESHWYYERARGQYKVALSRLTASERRRFEVENPRSQLFTKTDLAKVENSWDMLPYEVSKGAQKNFLRFAVRISAQWAKDPNEFNDEYYRGVIVKLILFRALERLIPKETWYGDYRAQLTTFSLAKLRSVILEQAVGRRLDFAKIWREQEASEIITEQMRVIAKAAFDVISAPEGGIQNVTEWCKKELAWQRLEARDVPLLPRMSSALEYEQDADDRTDDAHTDAAVAAEVDAMNFVIAYGSDEWLRAQKWVVARRIRLSTKETSLLQFASRPGWYPSGEAQSLTLTRILDKLKDEGYDAAVL